MSRSMPVQLYSTKSTAPVKVVNGTVIYIPRRCLRHEGSPPQQCWCESMGQAVLMTILKSGSVSDSRRHRRDQGTAARIKGPALSINLHAVVTNRYSSRPPFSAARRAARRCAGRRDDLALPGSWRSTMIIINLHSSLHLFSLAALSWLGETINIMTLGGLLCRRPCWVDEGTVHARKTFSII